jgi:hypothetical protein
MMNENLIEVVQRSRTATEPEYQISGLACLLPVRLW